MKDKEINNLAYEIEFAMIRSILKQELHEHIVSAICDVLNVTLDNTPIEVLNLSLRPYNVLKRAGINTIGQLTIKSDRELLKVKNLSLKCIEEIHKALEEYEEVIT